MTTRRMTSAKTNDLTSNHRHNNNNNNNNNNIEFNKNWVIIIIRF
jgi:hypothetical protein